MAASITDILAALQNAVTALNTMNQSLKTFFPQATTVSTSVTIAAAPITFNSSEATGFLLVNTSSGATFKVPVYNV